MPHTLVIYPLFLPSVGPMEMAVIFTVVLILFGPGKLPEVFRALGEGVRQFKEASKGASETIISSAPLSPSIPSSPVSVLPSGQEHPPVASSVGDSESKPVH